MSQQITHARLGTPVVSTVLASVCLALTLVIAGCSGGGGQSFFMVNKNTQAIQRDTIDRAGSRSFLQNPQDSTNGIVKMATVEPIPLVEVTLETGGDSLSPFDKPRKLMVPQGFSISVYARDLSRPRELALRDDGTLFVTDFDGRVLAITPDRKTHVIATDLRSPHGLEILNGALYYTDETRLFRFDFSSPTSVTGNSTLLSDKLPGGGLNYTRTIRWVPSDKRFYISVGSTQNKRVEDDNQHATLLRIGEAGGTPDAATRGGLRNVVGMDVHPETGELWGIDNGTELLSPLLPPTEVNILKIGKHYGWPFYYSKNFRDPDYADATTANNPRLPATPTPPIIELEGHVEALGMRFYPGTTFGPDWKNAMVIAYHDNCRVVRVRANGDGSNARQADVITGFLAPGDRQPWGRPAGIAIAKDGSVLYVSDDRTGAIYKVSKR